MDINWNEITKAVIAEATVCRTRTGTELHYASGTSSRTWCGCRAIHRYVPEGPVTCDKCLKAMQDYKDKLNG